MDNREDTETGEWHPVLMDEDTLRDMLRDIEDIKRRLELLRTSLWRATHHD